MKRRSSGVAAIALCAALLAPAGAVGRGTAATGDPGRFLIRMMEDKLAGRYGAAWSSLYPYHQSVVTRREYVACERQIPFRGTLVSVTVLRVSSGPVAVAGLARRVPGAAVTLRAVVRSAQLDHPVVVVHTFHAVESHGRWTWILSPDRFALYHGPGCGIHVPA